MSRRFFEILTNSGAHRTVIPGVLELKRNALNGQPRLFSSTPTNKQAIPINKDTAMSESDVDWIRMIALSPF
jgi:hypothetical protein